MSEECYSCINAERVQALTSRIDRLEVKVDNTEVILKSLQTLVNKSLFMLAGTIVTALLNLVMLYLGK